MDAKRYDLTSLRLKQSHRDLLAALREKTGRSNAKLFLAGLELVAERYGVTTTQERPEREQQAA